MNECILVVDDDPEIVGAIAITLEREGYRCLRAYDGLQALDLCLDPVVRLILIDVMMPRLDGLSALMRIREKRNLPVIVLSAKSEDSDKILGLSMGADDYVTKPFSFEELVARIRAVLRRSSGQRSTVGGEAELVNGPLRVCPATRRVWGADKEIHLADTEFRLLAALMKEPGTVMTHEHLLRCVWGT